MPSPVNDLDFIAARIDFDGPGGCWLWTGKSLRDDSYGIFRRGKRGRAVPAHRAVLEFFVEPIPPGLVVDHLCRVHKCVNPDHLEVVTHRENVWRGLMGVMKTSCVNGHEFTPENTRISSTGGRRCRTCKLNHGAAYRARRRAS